MENEYKVKQIWPNHADHISYYKEKVIDEMLNNEDVIIQPKVDGERMLMHFNIDEVYCTSRRISKKTGHYQENQDKIEKFRTLHLDGLGYTVLDGECYAENWSEIVGVLHSLPERAEALQRSVNVRYAVFDCLWYDGQDLTNRPYNERLIYMKKVLNMLCHPDIRYVGNVIKDSYQQYNVNRLLANTKWSRLQLEDIMNSVINLGYEGIVVKSLERAYYDKGACLKVKKFETVDVVVYGYTQGKGKYSNTVGALWVGYYDETLNSIKYLCNVNCSTDASRTEWKAWFDVHPNYEHDPLAWRVLEVKCQEITSKSLRHPVYIRIRDDKSYNMCYKSTIFKD